MRCSVRWPGAGSPWTASRPSVRRPTASPPSALRVRSTRTSCCWTCSCPEPTDSRLPSGSGSPGSPRSYSPPSATARTTVNASRSAAPRASSRRPRSRGPPCALRWGVADEMSPRLRRISLFAALAAGVADVALVLLFRRGAPPEIAYELIRDVGVSGSFVAAGIVAGARRPENPTGALMVVFGLAWSLHGIAAIPHPGAAAAWFAMATLPDAVLAHLILVFPEGRATARPQRLFLVANYATTVPVGLAQVLLVRPQLLPCPSCPDLLGAKVGDGFGNILVGVAVLIEVFLAAWLVRLLLGRWRSAPAPRRRLLAPVFVVGTVLVVVYMTQQGLLLALGLGSGPMSTLLDRTILALLILWPLAFLLGLAR